MEEFLALLCLGVSTFGLFFSIFLFVYTLREEISKCND